MTTLETKAGTADPNSETTAATVPTSAPADTADTAALITEQQVMFASAAALAPVEHHHPVHEFASAIRAMFVRPERSHPRRHYPQRFGYLETSAMSREMDRL
jgi:hypothetical protein